MEICLKIGDRLHCYVIPVIEFPVTIHRPGPGPVNFPQLFQDATILASLQAAAQKLSDTSVRETVESGVKTALQALQKRAGDYASVKHG
jgi:hypothetical protein